MPRARSQATLWDSLARVDRSREIPAPSLCYFDVATGLPTATLHLEWDFAHERWHLRQERFADFLAKSGPSGVFAYWLIVPTLLVILGLNLYPTIQGILTSFTNQSLIDPGHSLYLGLDNYFKLLRGPGLPGVACTFAGVNLSGRGPPGPSRPDHGPSPDPKSPGDPFFPERRDDHLGAADHCLGSDVPVHDASELRLN